jgi:hypothetical protein
MSLAAVKEKPAPSWADFGSTFHMALHRSDTKFSVLLWNLVQLDTISVPWEDFCRAAVGRWWAGDVAKKVARWWAVGPTAGSPGITLAMAFNFCDDDTWLEVETTLRSYLGSAVPMQPATTAEKINAAVTRAKFLKSRIIALTAEAEALSAEHQRLVRREILALMDEAGTGGVWSTPDVATVEVKTEVGGTMSKAEDPEAAVAYLREHDFGNALKTTLTVEFTEEERAVADALAKAIQSGTGKEAEIARAVNPQTLAAWARARIRAGTPTNLKILGLSTWREAVLKAPK